MLTTKDILEWDTVNWSVALRNWERHLPSGPADCLEIGSGAGGLSLWLASKGHHVVCSDRAGARPEARELHGLHSVPGKIDYAAVDATNIPYNERFDIIVFKSVLGRIWAICGDEGLRQALAEMRKALKPKGKLLFAENLRSTRFHMFCRIRFADRGEEKWKFLTIEEMRGLLADFSKFEYDLAGFLGLFGITETQRQVLGYVDKLLLPVVPKSCRYIMAGVAEK
ncbi:MAG TPA: class I SAM-dependent methyltransferase [Planctomycetaceae bacterium]|nr:class I SAM-dependent methyltransferase [Planctomycetaceae bacterium]